MGGILFKSSEASYLKSKT